MKPPPFQYHDPKTLAEAVGLLGTLDNAKLLAGGQSLMPMLNMRFVLPDHVIDLNRVEGLAGIRDLGDVIEIGAMTRQRDIEFSEVIKAKCPLLHEAIQFTGHRQTRNRGTIGGSLCHLDPSAEQVTVAAAHDATIVVAGPNGEREIAFADFPAGYLTPAIDLNEIVTAIRIPVWPAGHKSAFVEFARRHGDFAVDGQGEVGCRIHGDRRDGRVAHVAQFLDQVFGGVALEHKNRIAARNAGVDRAGEFISQYLGPDANFKHGSFRGSGGR